MSFSARTDIPLLFLAVASYFLYRVHEILLPFILASVLAFLFNPLVRFFEVRGLRRRPVVVVLYVSLMTVLALATYKLVWVAGLEAQKASHNMPLYVKRGGAAFANWRVKTRVNHALVDYIADHGRSWPQEVLSR